MGAKQDRLLLSKVCGVARRKLG